MLRSNGPHFPRGELCGSDGSNPEPPDSAYARLVYRKQRSGSELEYTEKLQQYSKYLRPSRELPPRGHLVMLVQLTS